MALSVGNNNVNTTFSGELTGADSLTKIGNGELVLSGSDAYTGGTFIDAGTLDATTSSAVPNGSSLVVGAGGTFIFDPLAAVAPSRLVVGEGPPSATATAVSEPGTAALLIAGASLLMLRLRRKPYRLGQPRRAGAWTNEAAPSASPGEMHAILPEIPAKSQCLPRNCL